VRAPPSWLVYVAQAALIAAIVVNAITLAHEGASPMIIAALVFCSAMWGVSMATWRWSHRHFTSVTDEIRRLPVQIAVHEDEASERRSAFVTRGNGDIVVVEIPEDVDDPASIVGYVMNAVMDDDA
jgi:hypothetical protein